MSDLAEAVWGAKVRDERVDMSAFERDLGASRAYAFETRWGAWLVEVADEDGGEDAMACSSFARCRQWAEEFAGVPSDGWEQVGSRHWSWST